MSYFPPTGSVVSFQSDPTKFVGIVSVVSHSPQSVAALQGTNPWIISNPSVTAFQGGGWATSIVGVAQIGGSVLVHTANNSVITIGAGVQITSVMNTVPSSMLVGASIFGTVPVTQVTNPWVTVPTSGSVLQGTSPWIINMPSPSVVATQIANSVMGVRTDNASVVAVLSNSSVAVLQGTTPWIVGTTSVQLISTSASVTALISNQLMGVSSVMLMSTSASIMVNNPAIFGANNTWAQSNSVLVIGAIRNDAMSSVTAADVRYSPTLVGPVGENISANAPINKWVSGWASITFLATPLQNLIPAGGTSVFTYVTGVQIANWSATGSVLVAIQSGATATLTIAAVPVNQTVVMNYQNPLKGLSNTAIQASIKAGPAASVFVSAQGFTSKFDT